MSTPQALRVLPYDQRSKNFTPKLPNRLCDQALQFFHALLTPAEGRVQDLGSHGS